MKAKNGSKHKQVPDNKTVVSNNGENNTESVKKSSQNKPLKRSKVKVGGKSAPDLKKAKEGQKTKKKRGLNGEDKKSVSFTPERYENMKKFLLKRGDEFEVVVSGISEKMKIDGKTYAPFDKNRLVGSGYHLSNLVKTDITKWLQNPENTLITRERDYTEQMFNLDAIEKNIGKPLISIDINDCYWQTAYNMTYITEKTYLSGLRKKEWKVGRNASIGSLCKAEMITRYKNGRIMRDAQGKLMRKRVYRDDKYQYVRHNIIGFIYDISVKLADILDGDFFMFLTDCVFTTIEKKKIVEQFFADYGYTCKSKSFEFTGVNRKEKTVEWIELSKPDTPKYYRYSFSQLYTPNKNVYV